MTLEEVQNAISEFGNDVVQVTLTKDREMKCILRDAYLNHMSDVRSVMEPYFYVQRIDTLGNPIQKYNCSEIVSIIRVN
jgi:hypothetical protein